MFDGTLCMKILCLINNIFLLISIFLYLPYKILYSFKILQNKLKYFIEMHETSL